MVDVVKTLMTMPQSGLRFFPEYNYIVQPSVIIGSAFLYLALVFLLKAIMQKRAPFQLTSFMTIYNALQILLCAFMTIGIKKKF